MPAVSVIVPVYNAEKYLCRCVDSILNQTFTDFELILVDDGSPDGSGAICDEYAQRDSRVRVFHKENGGAAAARNLGISMAQGQWISFVDSDDYVAECLYEEVFLLQGKYQADIVEFGIQSVSGDVLKVNESQAECIDACFEGIEMLPRIYQNCLGGSIYPVNKLYRESLFREKRFAEGRICEDTLIMPELYYSARKVAVTNQVLYYYVQTENSVMRSAFTLKKLDVIYAYQKNREFYLENELYEALEWHDATYVFLLLRMLNKVDATYGKTDEYKKLLDRFLDLYPQFMRNRRINVRQKLLLLIKRVYLG